MMMTIFFLDSNEKNQTNVISVPVFRSPGLARTLSLSDIIKKTGMSTLHSWLCFNP